MDIQSKYSIPKFERVLILSFSFVAFALFATGIFSEAVQSYNYSVDEYRQISGGGQPTLTIGLFHLTTFFIFLALVRGKFIVSTLITVVYLVLLIFSIWVRLDGQGSLGSENFYTDPWHELWMKTSHIDYFAAFAIIVLLIWQGAILWRVFLVDRRNMELN